MSDRPDLAPYRVRHNLKFRMLQVLRVQTLTPHLIRVTFTGDDLDDFESASFDDHIKVFFPAPGTDQLGLPTMGPEGLIFPGGERPVMRYFTPRRFDRATREFDIEFAVHEAGPAASWALQAKPGQTLGIGGPRGSLVIPAGFDWHLLIGDETALPAIARRLEELPAAARVTAIIEVADPSARMEFVTHTDLHAVWCYRSQSGARGAAMLEAIRETDLPHGEGYVWAAGESASMRAVRQHLVAERGIDKKRIRAAAYWRQGDAGVHENLDD